MMLLVFMDQVKYLLNLLLKVLESLPEDQQRATLKALGLTKLNKTVEKENNEFIQGMIKVVEHLVKVEEK